MLQNIPPPGALKALLSKPGDPTRQERKLRKTTRSWRLPNLGMTYKIRNLFASILVSFVFSAQFIIVILGSASWFEYGWYLAETNIISDILDRSTMIYTDGMGPAPKGMLKVFDHDHLQLLSLSLNHSFCPSMSTPDLTYSLRHEMKKVLIQNLSTRRQTRQLSKFGHGQSWENCRQLCHHPVPLPRWEPAVWRDWKPRKPQNAPVTNDSLASLHGTYALERSWKPKVWESCFPYESIVILISLKQFPWQIGTW